MSISHQHPFIQELTKALGLPKQTRSFALRVGMNEAVTVECTYYPGAPEAMGDVVHRTFRLVDAEGAGPDELNVTSLASKAQTFAPIKA